MQNFDYYDNEWQYTTLQMQPNLIELEAIFLRRILATF